MLIQLFEVNLILKLNTYLNFLLDMDGRYAGAIRYKLLFFLFSMICGQRVRVEHAKARSSNSRNAPTSAGYRGGE